ncbi:hypothetical protein AB3N60_11325 [Leptospira sp. WS39.C2]
MKQIVITLIILTSLLEKPIFGKKANITVYNVEVETNVFEKPSKKSKIIFKIPFGSKIDVKKVYNEENWLFSLNNYGYIESKKTTEQIPKFKKKYLILRKYYSDCWCYSSGFEINTELKLSSNKVFYKYNANIEYQEENGSSIGTYKIENNHLIIIIPKYNTEIYYHIDKTIKTEIYPELKYDLTWNDTANGYFDTSQSKYFPANYLYYNYNQCLIQPDYTEGSNTCFEYCSNPKENETRALFDGYFCSRKKTSHNSD